MTAGHRPAQPPPHPELDTIADLDAGVLADAEAERVAAHVATCARCGQVLAALGGVRAELRALPAPPIPAAVAARLDSTLAELSAAPEGGRADRPVAAAAQSTPAAVANLAAARERRWRRLKAATGAAAAVLALFVAGASITSLIRAGGGGSDSSAAGGGGGGQAEQQTSREQHDSAAAPGAAPAPTSLPALPGFDRATLRAALPSIEASATLARVTDAGKSGPAGAMADAGLRTACAETIAGSTGVLRAVRWIRYNGQPAYVFVFDEAGVRVAYVVGEQCGRSPAVPATVLDTVR